MWRSELEPEFVKMENEMEKDNQRIGSREQWYKGSVEYWD